MPKIYLFLLCTLFSTSVFSQVKISGAIRDSIGKGIQSANVFAVNQKTKTIDVFSISDAQGMYQLNVKKNTQYELTVSYLGMKTYKSQISTQDYDLSKDIILQADATKLEELNITYEIPIKVKGDTLTYNANSFRNQSDRKLEDVLKRLPGVEVTKEGQIKVEGKIVREIKVEGKRFFDGNTTLASKNIPAGVLDKIQVLKNEDNINQLREVRDNSENVSIDIKLKEGKTNFWFGDITAGGGVKERYLVNPKLFYYSPKQSANVILNFNNIGDSPLSASELSRFSVSQNDIHSKSGTRYNFQPAETSLALQNDMAKSLTNKFAAANLNITPTPFLDLTGYVIYAGSSALTQENSIKQFVKANSDITPQQDEWTNNQSKQVSDLGLFKLAGVFSPNKDVRLDYTTFGTYEKRQLNKDFYSSVLQNLDELNLENPYKIVQGLNYYHKVNEGNILAFESQYLTQVQDPFYNAVIAQPNLFNFTSILGLNPEQSSLQFNQEKKVRTDKFDAALNYWRVITRKSNVNITLGLISSRQLFNSNLYQILDNGDVFYPNPAEIELANAIKYNFMDAYIGLRYRLKAGIFVFEPASSFHSYQTRNQQFGYSTEKVAYRWLPSINIKAQLKSTEAVQLIYRKINRFTDVNNLAEGYVLNSYNRLFQGNRDLERTLSHDFSLTYYNNINQLSRYRFTTINGSLSYNKTTEAIRNRIEPEGVLQLGHPINSNFADETASMNVSLTRAFWRLVARGNAELSTSYYKQFVADQVSRNKFVNQSYDFNIKTNFSSNAPTVNMGYNLGINSYDLGLSEIKFFTDRYYIEAQALLRKGLNSTIKYEFNQYRDETKKINNYAFLNADLSYLAQNGKWEYVVRGMNLLNTKTFNNDSANEFYSVSQVYQIQPRYFVLSVKYHL